MRLGTVFGLGGAAILAAVIAASAPVQAAQGRNAALLGGLAIGAAGAAILMNGARPARAAPIIEEEVEYRPVPRYEPTCRMVRRKVWLNEESYTYRRVEICE